MGTVSRTPTVQHRALRRGLAACLKPHGESLEAAELLAVTAHLAGS